MEKLCQCVASCSGLGGPSPSLPSPSNAFMSLISRSTSPLSEHSLIKPRHTSKRIFFLCSLALMNELLTHTRSMFSHRTIVRLNCDMGALVVCVGLAHMQQTAKVGGRGRLRLTMFPADRSSLLARFLALSLPHASAKRCCSICPLSLLPRDEWK